jgi:hypothetical protein
MAFKISFKINWTRRFFVSVLLRLGSTSAKSDIQLKKCAGAALHFKIIDCRPPSVSEHSRLLSHYLSIGSSGGEKGFPRVDGSVQTRARLLRG